MKIWLNGLSYKDGEEEMRQYEKKNLKMFQNTIDSICATLMAKGQWR